MVQRVKARTERKSGFVYKRPPAESIKSRGEQKGDRFDSPLKDGVDAWRPKDGDNLIRFLPNVAAPGEDYVQVVWVHRYVGADSSTYLCPNKMLKKHCPMCDAYNEAKAAGETEEAKQLKPVEQKWAWILDRDDESNTPMVYQMSWSMDRDIAALCTDKRKGNTLYIDDPDNGYDVTIKRSGKGMKTKYFGQAIDRQSSAIDEDEKEQDRILEYVGENPLSEVLKFYPESYLEGVITGTIAEKDELDDDAGDKADKPRGRRAAAEEEEVVVEDEAPRSRRRAAPEPEEEAEEAPPRRRGRAEPEEEVVDDEPAPRARGRRAAEPEEEAEEAPRRRRPPADEPEDEPAPRTSRRRAEPEEEVVDDEPAPRARGRRAEPEEDVVDDEPAPRARGRRVEQEEDEPAPKRGRRAAAEPEEELDPEEGGDEEDQPRRRSRR